MCIAFMITFFPDNIVECGIPKPPTNGTIVRYTGTYEGSIACIQCRAGLQLQGEPVSECTQSGRWTVNTSDQLCINNTTGENFISGSCMGSSVLHGVCTVLCKCVYATIGSSLFVPSYIISTL